MATTIAFMLDFLEILCGQYSYSMAHGIWRVFRHTYEMYACTLGTQQGSKYGAKTGDYKLG